MLNLFTTSEFWAAIVGGIFTLAGSSLSLWLQQRLQNKEKGQTALAFVRDQAAHFNIVVQHIENHFNARGEIWIEYTNDIDASYAIVNRNVELITFLGKSIDKNSIRSYFSNVYHVSRRATYWQNQFYAASKKLKSVEEGSAEEKKKCESDMINARQQMKDCVLELKRIALSTPSITHFPITTHG